ncbi:MAG: 23S rRNA (guanosine(2251)-2'-O)-methyltransferase RlmB [Firmicutes bacterium]|nr:23S rRNA (guanosine(2251)-2'-O)-methyltransferase RlmB [Bacillota bacterium]
MSKRDNPRLKQREEEKRAKREKYLQAKERRESRGRSGQETGRAKPSRPSRVEKEYAPREVRTFRGYNDDGDGKREAFSEGNPNLIIGRNPVMEAVKSGRTIDKILMQKDGEGSIRKIASLARERGLLIQYVDRVALDRLTQSHAHQGIAAYVSAYSYCEITDILQRAKDRGEAPFVILLDGLEDPHNLGAIMRTADAVGAHGIVIPNRRAVGLTETVAKASAGAIEYIPVARVANMTAAIDELKKEGLWIGACDMDGQEYYQAELSGPLGLVVGSEGQGVSRLVRENCDFILSIPMVGRISSLNASNAAAILMYEVFRQRTEK